MRAESLRQEASLNISFLPGNQTVKLKIRTTRCCMTISQVVAKQSVSLSACNSVRQSVSHQVN